MWRGSSGRCIRFALFRPPCFLIPIFWIYSFVLTLSTTQRFSPQFLLMRLKHSKTAQDDASEALASAFVQQSSSSSITISDTGTGTGTPNGNGTGREIDDFVREFKDMRKVYHKRVIWEDRWSAGLVNWRDD
jgi:hypothetical protein